MTERYNLCVLDGGDHPWLHAPLPGVLHDAAFDNCGLHDRLGNKDATVSRIAQLREKARTACEYLSEEAFTAHFHRLLVCALYCTGPCGKSEA